MLERKLGGGGSVAGDLWGGTLNVFGFRRVRGVGVGVHCG